MPAAPRSRSFMLLAITNRLRKDTTGWRRDLETDDGVV
jgi:hypothetical protein